MRYQQLTSYLLQFLPKDYQRNFYSWIENGRLINKGRDITEHGKLLAVMETECVFWFEELPFKKINPQKLMALIEIWLNENSDCEYFPDENDEIPFELVLLDDNTADLQFSLKFIDPLYLQADDGGEFNLHGEAFNLEAPEIWTAEHFDIEARIRHAQKWKKQD